jgi:hypothetical protein
MEVYRQLAIDHREQHVSAVAARDGAAKSLDGV